jgi:succinate-acetate transporter protein
MLAGAAMPVMASFDFEVQQAGSQVPAPGPLGLLALGLAAALLSRRRGRA